MTKRMTRPPHETRSSGRVGKSTARSNPAPSVAPTTIAPRASEPVSRRAATSTSVTPRNASVVGIKASGSRPPFRCTSARTHANAIASIAARATRSAAKARELDRRTSLPLREDVVRDALRDDVRSERRRYLSHGHDEDAVVRAPKRDRRVGESRAEARRDDYQRRAPGQAAALAEKDRLGRADGVRTEAREDLEAARQRPGSASERGSGPLVREVVDPVRHEANLASGRRGKAYQLRSRRHDELGGLGIGLDPVLLVRSDVDEEDRVEACRRLVELRVKLAEA